MNRARAKNRVLIFSILAAIFVVLALVTHLQIREAETTGKISVANRANANQPITVISAQGQPREFKENLASKGIFRALFLLGLVVTGGMAARSFYWLRQHPR